MDAVRMSTKPGLLPNPPAPQRNGVPILGAIVTEHDEGRAFNAHLAGDPRGRFSGFLRWLSAKDNGRYLPRAKLEQALKELAALRWRKADRLRQPHRASVWCLACGVNARDGDPKLADFHLLFSGGNAEPIPRRTPDKDILRGTGQDRVR